MQADPHHCCLLTVKRILYSFGPSIWLIRELTQQLLIYVFRSIEAQGKESFSFVAVRFCLFFHAMPHNIFLRLNDGMLIIFIQRRLNRYHTFESNIVGETEIQFGIYNSGIMLLFYFISIVIIYLIIYY